MSRQPWLLFMPDGTYDGMIWSPETADVAHRAFARMRRQRWTTFEPSHRTEIAAEDDGLPTEVIYAAVAGACKATLNSIPEPYGGMAKAEIEDAIAGLSTSCIGPSTVNHGPYTSEEAAETELKRLRDHRLIHATNSTVFQLPDEEAS